MVVPHGSAESRTYSISSRTVQAAKVALSLLILLATIGAGLAVALFAGPVRLQLAGRPAADDGTPSLVARLERLQDTLEVIRTRDQQIRLLAGLPNPDSLVGMPVALADSGPTSAPFPTSDGQDRGLDFMIQRANTLAASFAEVTDTLERNAERYARIPSIMPTAGWLSSAFSRSRFHPILHTSRPHEGIDVSAPMGAPIVAPAAGTVRRVGRERGYGLVLEIDHGDGIVTKYAHCSRVMVRNGQRVKRGQEVAAVGNSGLSTGPHLHYEIHVDGRVVDPLTYVLPEGAIPD
jgi:murein DD-endopeptidase MepM/ murein hydrolase activator NlpD